MAGLDLAAFLKYGALGLGLALALLTYRLLAREQNHEPPRLAILSATYVFMLFALLLASSGFAVEFFGKRWPVPTPTPQPAVSVLDGPVVEYRWETGTPPQPAKPAKPCSCFPPIQLPSPFPTPFKAGALIMFSNNCATTIDMVFVKYVPRSGASVITDPHFARIAVPTGATLKIDLGGAAAFGDAIANCPT